VARTAALFLYVGRRELLDLDGFTTALNTLAVCFTDALLTRTDSPDDGLAYIRVVFHGYDQSAGTEGHAKD